MSTYELYFSTSVSIRGHSALFKYIQVFLAYINFEVVSELNSARIQMILLNFHIRSKQLKKFENKQNIFEYCRMLGSDQLLVVYPCQENQSVDKRNRGGIAFNSNTFASHPGKRAGVNYTQVKFSTQHTPSQCLKFNHTSALGRVSIQSLVEKKIP